MKYLLFLVLATIKFSLVLNFKLIHLNWPVSLLHPPTSYKNHGSILDLKNDFLYLYKKCYYKSKKPLLNSDRLKLSPPEINH